MISIDARKAFDKIKHQFMILKKPLKTKAKIYKLDLIKCQGLCTVKETINNTKRQPNEWEKVFANNMINKGLIPKIKSSYNSISKNNLIYTLPDVK